MITFESGRIRWFTNELKNVIFMLHTNVISVACSFLEYMYGVYFKDGYIECISRWLNIDLFYLVI